MHYVTTYLQMSITKAQDEKKSANPATAASAGAKPSQPTKKNKFAHFSGMVDHRM